MSKNKSNIYFYLTVAIIKRVVYNKAMEKFYVFLDIDGTLWDNSNSQWWRIESDRLNPQSIYAANTLIEKLKSRDYNPEFVIISRRRTNWNNIKKVLYSQGLTPDIPMHKLPFGKLSRGHRISIFLHTNKSSKNQTIEQNHMRLFDRFHTSYANKTNNYVVIDDNRNNLLNIPTSHHIQPDMQKRCLDMKHVKDFLELLDKNFDQELEK